MNKQINDSASENAKGKYQWSWWNPILSVEYASRGKVGMGVCLAFINFIPLTWIFTALVLKNKSVKDLSTENFSWNKNAKLVMTLQVFIWLVVVLIKSNK